MRKYSVIIPINNFDSDIEQFQFEGKFQIRKTAEKELGSIQNMFLYPVPLRVREALSGVKYILEYKSQGDIKVKWSYANEIITALRLLKAGDVCLSISLILEKGKIISWGYSHIKEVYERPYFLKKQEQSAFFKLWRKLSEIQTSKVKEYLRFPLQVFNKSYYIDFIDDRFVQCMIGLESLVFHELEWGGEQKGKAMGLAISMLLGNNERERKEIKKNLKIAYTLRNFIVHGNVKELKRYDYKRKEECLFKTEDYLRSIFRKFVEE